MIITILVLISNYLFGQDNNSNHYKTLKTIDNIEIREYNESMNISYHDESSENYFQKLANYIFGGNDKNQKISMTSPVTMRQYGNKEMIFRLPNNFMSEEAPKPENNQIKIFKIESNIKATIRYSGYTNKSIEKKKTKELTTILNENNIKFKQDFEVDVYNSPFQFINRRNEITVSIISDF
mgnify:FL=1